MKKYKNVYRVYIFNKNFKRRNARGYPPDYMFWGKNTIGERYDLLGDGEEDVLEYVNSCLTDEQKENFEVMVKYLHENKEE